MTAHLTDVEKSILLRMARQSLECAVRRESLPPVNQADLTPALREQGASFVTLTEQGDLRGCIGALEAYQPLYEDVRQHAASAALEDYRFPQVQPDELPGLQIEISRLTPPQNLEYTTPEELLALLRPGIDGVILRDGLRRATFLPQVWEKIPTASDFLSQLCYKMSAPPDLWQKKHLLVQIYQVEEFHEPGNSK